jgi:hypothetical protein
VNVAEGKNNDPARAFPAGAMETYSAAAACENATVISSIQLSPLLSFLIAVQTAALASLGGGPNFDPKFYVDLPLKYPLNVTTKAFQTLSSSSQNTTIAPSIAITIHHHPFCWGVFFLRGSCSSSAELLCGSCRQTCGVFVSLTFLLRGGWLVFFNSLPTDQVHSNSFKTRISMNQGVICLRIHRRIILQLLPTSSLVSKTNR